MNLLSSVPHFFSPASYKICTKITIIDITENSHMLSAILKGGIQSWDILVFHLIHLAGFKQLTND